MPSFDSKPFDGQHPLVEAGTDWRADPGPAGVIERALSYGNYAGPGNRILSENADYVEQQRKLNPDYNENRDPRFANDPRYRPVDGIDAAAKEHDTGYPDHLHGESMFSWTGMHNVEADDEKFVDQVGAAVDGKGASYSEGARQYSEGMRGFFASRVMGMEAVDWAGHKATEAGQGIGQFIDDAKQWGSVGEAAHGIGAGLSGAGSWLAETGGEVWQGLKTAGSTIGKLGWPGAIAAALGFGNVAAAGAAHVGSEALGGARALAGQAAGSAEKLFAHYTD